LIQLPIMGSPLRGSPLSRSMAQATARFISDFSAGVMRTAVALRRHEQELKERESERQRRVQEMIKLRAQIEAEEKKVEQFNQSIESWEKAERLRRFIAAYAEKLPNGVWTNSRTTKNGSRGRTNKLIGLIRSSPRNRYRCWTANTSCAAGRCAVSVPCASERCALKCAFSIPRQKCFRAGLVEVNH